MTRSTCNATNCRFTDLSSTHGRLTITRGRGRRHLYTDEKLPLKNVTDMPTLVIFDDTASRVSCATVAPRLGARATFTGDVKGDITCIPIHDGSDVVVKLSNLQRLAGSYHIHRYPVADKDCHSTGAHFNPFNVTKSPTASRGSDDQYEVGDLSSLFGSLKNRTSVSFHRFAPNLKCDKILGRSIVIHYTGGKRWQCATLEPVLPGESDTRETEWIKHSGIAHFTDYHDGYVKLVSSHSK